MRGRAQPDSDTNHEQVTETTFTTMKHNGSSAGRKRQPDTALRPNGSAGLNQNEMGVPPSADEVATRAYLSYGARVYLPEYEVQHWLEAEQQLFAERSLTQIT